MVDLITNSSSEIFISADEKTIEAIKGIINDVLKAGGSQVTADQMFDFALVVSVGYPGKYVLADSDEGKAAIEEAAADNNGNGAELEVQLTPKINDVPEIARLAKTLSNLTGLYILDGWYNG